MLNSAATTTTTSALLDALNDPAEETVWNDFDGRYRPIITAFAGRLGLDGENAAEVAQQTLTDFVRDYRAGKYDRGKGRLSAWIIGIARHRVLDVCRDRDRRRQVAGSSGLVDLADEQHLTQIWERERESAIFDQAFQQLHRNTKTSPETIRVFQLVAIEGQRAADVAEQCNMQTAEVYRIKNRITKRLRQIVAELTHAYVEDG